MGAMSEKPSNFEVFKFKECEFNDNGNYTLLQRLFPLLVQNQLGSPVISFCRRYFRLGTFVTWRKL
jgi:hypothetical protein